MAHTLRYKNTAAYAASQPLFDALRHACDRISEQHAHLAHARDLVQTSHVKLPINDEADEAAKCQDYMNRILTACRIAMETYAGVFDALSAITAADITEGRGERDGHQTFANIATLAAQAHHAATAYEPSASATDTSRQTSVTRDTAVPNGTYMKEEEKGTYSRAKRALPDPSLVDDGERRNKMPKLDVSTDRAPPRQRSLGGRGTRSNKTTTLPHRNSPVPNYKRESPQVQTQARALANGSVEPDSYSTQHKEPGVKYLNVTAEVDARLRAKEEKKRQKDSEKKRKRRSEQNGHPVEGEVKRESKRIKPESDRIANHNHSQPSKRKSNSAHASHQTNADAGISGRQKKRKKMSD